jgi:hypothetical protein
MYNINNIYVNEITHLYLYWENKKSEFFISEHFFKLLDNILINDRKYHQNGFQGVTQYIYS